MIINSIVIFIDIFIFRSNLILKYYLIYLSLFPTLLCNIYLIYYEFIERKTTYVKETENETR